MRFCNSNLDTFNIRLIAVANRVNSSSLGTGFTELKITQFNENLLWLVLTF